MWQTHCKNLSILGIFGLFSLLPFASALDLHSLTLPSMYQIEVIADIPKARSMAVAEEIATLFVGTRGKKLYAIHGGEVFQLANTLNVPNGVAWQHPYLYVAEQHRISRFAFPQFQESLPEAEDIIALPNYRHHGWRVLRFSPDGVWLYVALGAPCNICKLQGLHGTIARLKPQEVLTRKTQGLETALQIAAYGVRNSVGMDFHPQTGKLYFTDNGADNMGDDVPKEEINRLDRTGQHFGFPFYGGGLTRTSMALPKTLPANIKDFTAPTAQLPAHNAPLGIHFYHNLPHHSVKMPGLDNKALVALHGSWNRRIPDGYKVVLVDFSGHSAKVEGFIDGFLQMREGRGRPVDIATLWDGSILISDDGHGKIYQVMPKNE